MTDKKLSEVDIANHDVDLSIEKSNQCKDVAVITVIKDESAYIHEWIHHYIYFGFKHIYLAVNRTSDQTTKILDLICEQYSNVKYFVTDWIDKDADKTGINPSMQRLSFSFLANEAFNNPNVSHCLSVDADEFFYPTNFKQGISEFINTLPYHSRLSVHWACQDVDDLAFTAPFINKEYYTTSQVKTIIAREAFNNMRKFTLHVPLMKVNYRAPHIETNGDIFRIGKHREISDAHFNTDQKAFILHRMIRSESEYLALLLKRNPESTLRIKNNRDGLVSKRNLLTLELDEGALSHYYQSLDRFIMHSGIADIISGIRDELKALSEDILNTSDEEILQNLDVYYKVLKGTSVFSSLHERVKNINSSIITNDGLIDKIRDTALSIESYDMRVSLDLLLIVQKFRPHGTLISYKIEEYNTKLKDIS